jgi:nucleoside-diphosphate-sugar epimerase
MDVLITGAAGNLGTLLTRHLLQTKNHQLRLLVHKKQLPPDISGDPKVSVIHADLGDATTLRSSCSGIDLVIHLAGVLFRPRPDKFLRTTNFVYARNIIDVALMENASKFLLFSFPHVEGESTLENRSPGALNASPNSLHAQTRLDAEKYLFQSCCDRPMRPIVFRAGFIYGKGVKLLEAARWMMKRNLLAIWKKPTWIHLLSLPDLFHFVEIAIERNDLSGIYNLADDEPLTLQEFLDHVAEHWNFRKPLRLPQNYFQLMARTMETVAALFQTRCPLSVEILKMGMTSVVADTTRMKKELTPHLLYPSWREGMVLID